LVPGAEVNDGWLNVVAAKAVFIMRPFRTNALAGDTQVSR